MKIKSLLLGSAAALVAVSGARAADAVVIPEPEAVEYVRVCDAKGEGYFYIPGGETCLKISGYVQYQISTSNTTDDGWNKATEARLQFDSWTDSELGPVETQIRLTSGTSTSTTIDSAAVFAGTTAADLDAAITTTTQNVMVLDRATLSIGGLSMGLMGNLYDFSATGAADAQIGNGYTANAIQYVADFGSGTFGVQLLQDQANNTNYVPDVVAKATFAVGDAGLEAGVAYDESASEYSAKVIATIAGFGAVVQYSSAVSDFSGSNEWVIGANYGFDATDKLNLNLGVAYGFGDSVIDASDNWTIGAEAAYKLTDTFTVSARARAMDNSAYDARLRFKAEF